jgi:DNA-directed RNA polymerase specialized sigma24 family protein
MLKGLLSTLNPKRKTWWFVLREVEGLEAIEFCKILDVSATNFGMLFYRARARLRECLRPVADARDPTVDATINSATSLLFPECLA